MNLIKKIVLPVLAIALLSIYAPKIASQTFYKYGVEIQFTEVQEGEIFISITNQNEYTTYCQLLINKQIYWVMPLNSGMTYNLEFNNNIDMQKMDLFFWKCWGAGFYQFRYLGTFTYNIH
jgi:hypothetical protein